MQRGVFVWIDTSDRVYYEDRNILDETIELFQSLYAKYTQSWGGGRNQSMIMNMRAIVSQKNRW